MPPSHSSVSASSSTAAIWIYWLGLLTQIHDFLDESLLPKSLYSVILFRGIVWHDSLLEHLISLRFALLCFALRWFALTCFTLCCVALRCFVFDTTQADSRLPVKLARRPPPSLVHEGGSHGAFRAEPVVKNL